MRPRWPIVALLAGAATLGAAFLGNLVAIEAAGGQLAIIESTGSNAKVTFHAYHVVIEPGDALVIPPTLFTGRFVYMDVVEGGELAYIERGLSAPHTYLHVEPPEALRDVPVNGSRAGVYIDYRDWTFRLDRPPRPADVAIPNGTRWDGLDANGLDVVFWVSANDTRHAAGNSTAALLLHPSSSGLGRGGTGVRTIDGWLPEAQLGFYAIEGAATLATLAGAVGLALPRPRPARAAGLEGYALLAERAETYVRDLRLLLVGSGILFVVLGAFGVVAIVSVFDELAYAHAFPSWRLPLALMAAVGFSALVGGWAAQALRVHREVRRLRSREPPPLP